MRRLSDEEHLGGVLRGAATAFRPLAGQHTLEADIPEDLPLAYGDAMATDIVVGQLLENAFKYSPQGGTVTVAARRAGDRIEVTVADEGIGIPPADLERVFERFVQGETGDRRRFGGIGLGLYIVRQLARAQGGEVAAEGRPSGGTLMRLRVDAPTLDAVATESLESATVRDQDSPEPSAGYAGDPS